MGVEPHTSHLVGVLRKNHEEVRNQLLKNFKKKIRMEI
jgi:hypothetical protein